MAERRIRYFVDLMQALRSAADRHDPVFAGALGDCLSLVSTPDSICPVAQLLTPRQPTRDERQAKIAQAGPDAPPGSAGDTRAASLAVFDRTDVVNRLHRLAVERAIDSRDYETVEALVKCETNRHANFKCPLYRRRLTRDTPP